MSKGSTSKVTLLVDDEPEYLGWVVEFLESLGLQCDSARNLSEALAAIEKTEYRLLIVDMNIPAGGAASALTKAHSPVAEKYPGIIVAVQSRNKGYGAHQIIAYTVHDDDAADAELAKLNCRYVLKARPQVLKSVIKASLKSRPPFKRKWT